MQYAYKINCNSISHVPIDWWKYYLTINYIFNEDSFAFEFSHYIPVAILDILICYLFIIFIYFFIIMPILTFMTNKQGWIFHVLPQKGHKQNYILKVSMTMHFKLSHVLWKSVCSQDGRRVKQKKWCWVQLTIFHTKHVLICIRNL